MLQVLIHGTSLKVSVLLLLCTHFGGRLISFDPELTMKNKMSTTTLIFP